MAKLSEKYIAGFIDADGFIGPRFDKLDRANSNPGRKRVGLEIKANQQAMQDEVLYRIQQTLGGYVRSIKDGRATEWSITGRAAIAQLDKIRKHLVVKRRIAETMLDRYGEDVEVQIAKEQFKQARREKALPLPNFPPRKWLAGYFDGDGCINIRLPKGRKSAQVTLSITASDYDSEGIEILHKAFGGCLNDHGIGRKHLVRWLLTLPPSKAKQVLGYFSKHLINKKEQADFILGCAEMGHYRDGNRIKSALKHLKAHPHRLSGPKADTAVLLNNIRDIETRQERGQRLFKGNGDACIMCNKHQHYCDGFCGNCYNRTRLSA